MNKAPYKIKNFLTFNDLKGLMKEDVFAVEIGREPKKVLQNSLWVGYRNGGMASWMSSLLPHLPQKKFCLFMDKDEYKTSEYMFSYYSEYFHKLFHKEFIGVCVHSRKSITENLMKEFRTVTASSLFEQLSDEFDCRHTALLDLRNAEMAAKDSLRKIVEGYENSSYINLPLNDDDLTDLILDKTSHLPRNSRFVTLCEKGYRSAIGYSFLELIKESNWNITSCVSPLSEVKKELLRPKAELLRGKAIKENVH